eukprot:9406123-Ditylum_brightwellii.AAC.1
MDSLRLFRLNGVLLNNNAVACYDQMISAMKHYIQTSTGESSEFYQHTEEYMKRGKGQGKTSSLPNWLFQSSTLLNSLEVQCEGLYMTSVDG